MEDGSNESNSTEIDLENLSSQGNSVYISSNKSYLLKTQEEQPLHCF